MKLTMLELHRRARGWSQAALAEYLGPGFTASAVSLMESQRLRPSTRQQQRLRELFGDEAEAMLQPIDPSRLGAKAGEPS
jgi:ribosome-binding protein aMBF1 (putative translation factor)